jgi:hypothetical protein
MLCCLKECCNVELMDAVQHVLLIIFLIYSFLQNKIELHEVECRLENCYLLI